MKTFSFYAKIRIDMRQEHAKKTMYYAENPESQHDFKEIRATLLGEFFRFATDSGVFSKNRIDYGSQVLLDSLDFQAGDSLLDLGCGYGPLGIALAKVQKVEALLLDINERALDLARQNAVKNQTEVTVLQSYLYDQVEARFDHIISNPPIRAGKDIVHRIIEEAPRYLKAGGDLTIVIQKKQGAPSAKKKMEAIFGNVETLKKDKGYYVLRSEKNESS